MGLVDGEQDGRMPASISSGEAFQPFGRCVQQAQGAVSKPRRHDASFSVSSSELCSPAAGIPRARRRDLVLHERDQG